MMDVDALGSRRRSGYAREGVPSIVGGDRNIGVIDSGGLSCLVEYPIEVIVTIVDERHGVGQHIMVGEYDFHRRRLADSRPCPSPDFASIDSGSYEFAEVTTLTAAQVSSATFHKHLAVDRFTPTETGLLKVGTIVAIDSSHASWRIIRLGVVRLFRSRKRLGINIRKNREA